MKELRAREITDLRNAKNELRKARESERVSVCNQSALFASKIKQNQCEELQRKMRMATQIKQEYLSYRRSQEEARSESYLLYYAALNAKNRNSWPSRWPS